MKIALGKITESEWPSSRSCGGSKENCLCGENHTQVKSVTKYESIFFKLSDDVPVETPGVIPFIKIFLDKGNFVQVCPGAGKSTNKVFDEKGWKNEFGPRGRIFLSDEQRMVAKKIYDKNWQRTKSILIQHEMDVEVIPPYQYFGSRFCPINGDDIVEIVYNGFDNLYALTLLERKEKKEERFKHLPNVKVICFS